MVYRTHFAPKDPHNRVLNFGELDAGVCVCVRVCVCVCVSEREGGGREGGGNILLLNVMMCMCVLFYIQCAVVCFILSHKNDKFII